MHTKQLHEQMSTIPTAIAMASAFQPTFFLHRADWQPLCVLQVTRSPNQKNDMKN
jgi:hypothetical protein